MPATNLFTKYETDPAKEVAGTEIDIEGNIFICRRAGGGNRAYRARLGVLVLDPKYKDDVASEDDVVSSAAEDEVTLLAYADSVVLGWRDVVGRDGLPLEFSRENFLDLMRSCPDVWMKLRFSARDIDMFRLTQVEVTGTEVGNL